MGNSDARTTCFVCGYRTLVDRCDWEVCPVCFWEDDVLVGSEDRSSPANGGMMVSDAQANFMRYSAASREFADRVEPPDGYEKDPSWVPLPEAVTKAKNGDADR